MQRFKAIAIGVTTALALGGIAQGTLAQSGQSSAPAKRMEHRRAADPAAVQQRLDRLKSELKITQAQEPAWTAYASEVSKQAAERQALRQGMQANRPATLPERLDQRSQAMKKGQELFERRAAAAKSLYAALSPEQRTLADQRLARGPGGEHRHHRGHGGPARS